MQKFSTTDVRKILGIKYPRLREWIDRGYLTPSVKPEGPGSRTVFTLEDLYHAKIFMYLLDMGYGRGEASHRVNEIAKYNKFAAQRAKKTGATWPSHDFAVLIRRPGTEKPKGGSLIDRKLFEEEPMAEIMGGDDFTDAVIINLAKLRRDVEEDIKRL